MLELAKRLRPSRKQLGSSLLALYGHVFRDIIGSHSGDHLEIEVRMTPGDEVCLVTVRLPTAFVAQLHTGEPLLTISSALSSEDSRPIEISDLTVSGSSITARRKLNTVSADIYADGFVPHNSTVTISFKAWELAGPLEGAAPYLYATLATHICLPALQGIPVVLTLVTPRDTAPRSTQGNYLLAYPSRTYQGERYTNIYFRDAADIAIRYRCANMVFKLPWQAIGKAAVSAAFVFFISALVPDARNTDLAARLLAVIGAFVASAGTVWDFIQELTVFAIYDRRNNQIGFLVLACQLSVITIISMALVRLSVRSAAVSLSLLPIFTLGLTILLVLLAAAGFILHSLGWWQGFSCDCNSCQNRLRIRRGRPECQYTGRVFCDDHIFSVCSNCCHGADLLSGRLDSVAQHTAEVLPCIRIRPVRAAPDSTDPRGLPGDGHEVDVVQ